MTALLVLIVLAFAWSIGAHYTGACMGMSYGSGSIRLQPALWLMAVLALLGAILISHGVERTVGLQIVSAERMTMAAALAIIVAAFLLTTVYTAVKVPTSTIQIFVFCVVGVALASGVPVDWWTIVGLGVLWVIAPPVALALGYIFTRLLDRLPRGESLLETGTGSRISMLAGLLVLMGAAASFTMGGNDVSNATGVFIMTRTFNVWTAGAIGGIGLLIGVVTWGRPLLNKVAFDIVHVDLAMATGAQLAQAVVVLAAVFFGGFTSMNQALVGAMTGAGLARGNETIQWRSVTGILKGWAIGPPSGIVFGFLLAKLAGVWFPL